MLYCVLLRWRMSTSNSGNGVGICYWGNSGDTPTIKFLYTAHWSLAGQQKKKYTEANTCAVTLRLPLLGTYNAFRDFMVSGIVNSPQFGVA